MSFPPHAFAGLMRRAAVVACAALLHAVPVHAAQPFIWDDDNDGLDDRMETVDVLGFRFSFEDADTLKRQRFVVAQGSELVYGVYVMFDDRVTESDLVALTSLGMPVKWRYEAVPAVRSYATFAQAQAARLIPGVVRVEVIPILYGVTREDLASAAVRDASGEVWPTWTGAGGGAGDGVVIGVLDSGANDQPSSNYPGHEALAGRVIGGASFTHGDSTLDTPRGGSVNPEDGSGTYGHSHGTHVASIALGTGGATGYATGGAPGARLVDVRVTNGAGFGIGVAEALDWCIHNRTRDWGAGAAYTGLDVLNLSLSSLDASDGNDFASQLAARAVELGMLVVASMGNDGLAGHVPSPAAGDGVIAVGAYDAGRTGRSGDDTFAAFSNRGPRHDDGDLDPLDEQKPDLLAPGVAVLSADGRFSSGGDQYLRLTGTSMSSALVAGAVAALRSEFPSLAPGAIADLLRRTARRDLLGIPAAAPGPDPRWHAARGFGAVDLYAARLELVETARTQFRRLAVESSAAVTAFEAWTQREQGAAHVVFERAPDLGGTPGAFAALDSLPATGSPGLDGDNRHVYTLVRPVTPGELGSAWWVRVATTEGGVRHASAARRYVVPAAAPVGRIEVTVVHNAYDSDVDAEITAGSLAFPLPGTASAVASDWVSGISTLGNVAWTFSIPIPAGAAEALLPPSPDRRWTLRVTENGYLNRRGRVTDFRVVWYASGGELAHEGRPLPLLTLEGASVEAHVPSPAAGVPGGGAAAAFSAGPNPVAAGGDVVFRAAGAPAGPVRIFDLHGRQVGVAWFAADGGGSVARWSARDRRGEPLPSGLYFARAGAGSARITVIRR